MIEHKCVFLFYGWSCPTFKREQGSEINYKCLLKMHLRHSVAQNLIWPQLQLMIMTWALFTLASFNNAHDHNQPKASWDCQWWANNHANNNNNCLQHRKYINNHRRHSVFDLQLWIYFTNPANFWSNIFNIPQSRRAFHQMYDGHFKKGLVSESLTETG